jgi:glucose uptake protein
MFTPHSLGLAMGMMIATAFCWGSWANTYKGVKGYRFELFYWDYAIGIFLSALAYAFTMGSSGNNFSTFTFNVHIADASNIGWAMGAGAIFNLANLLLVAGIDMAGLATAFPISIGIALVIGVFLSYMQQPQGKIAMLAGGVSCALLAVVLDGKAYGRLGTGRETSRKSIAVCVVSGILMGLWAPFSTRALTTGAPLSPYGVVVFLTLGALLSCFIWNFLFMANPIAGEPVGIGGFFDGPVTGHLLGLLGGFIWTTGTVFSLVAANYTGVATSYAIGQSAPMVAALWGIFVWHEFRGADLRAKRLLVLMFLFYALAIGLVAWAIKPS